MRGTEYVEVASRVLDEAQVRYHFGQGGKHPFVRILWADKSRKMTFPASGSDWRGVRNFESDIRKLLRTMGVPEVGSPVMKKAEPVMTTPLNDVSAMSLPAPRPSLPRLPGEAQNDYVKRCYRDEPEYRIAYLEWHRERKRLKAEAEGRPYRPRLKTRVTADEPIRERGGKMLPGETKPEYNKRRYATDPAMRETVVERGRERRELLKASAEVASPPNAQAVEHDDIDPILNEARNRFQSRIAEIRLLRTASTALLDILSAAPLNDNQPLAGLIEAVAAMIDERATRLSA